jgi:AcrR family transcriptional regulator
MPMAARRRVRRPPREETRREILDAAARAFARRGFHGASVETVAAEAGLTTGAVYSNFKGKEDLFLTLYEERIAARSRDLRAAAGEGDDPLGSAAANVAQMLSREWLLLYFEFALHAARNPAFARRFRALRRDGLDALEQGIAEGLERAGRDPSGAGRIARTSRAAVYGLALEHLLGEARRDDAAVADALSMIFAGGAA